MKRRVLLELVGPDGTVGVHEVGGRAAVTCRQTLNPVSEIMPDRCTPEYARTVAKMSSLLPYRRAIDGGRVRAARR